MYEKDHATTKYAFFFAARSASCTQQLKMQNAGARLAVAEMGVPGSLRHVPPRAFQHPQPPHHADQHAEAHAEQLAQQQQNPTQHSAAALNACTRATQTAHCAFLFPDRKELPADQHALLFAPQFAQDVPQRFSQLPARASSRAPRNRRVEQNLGAKLASNAPLIAP